MFGSSKKSEMGIGTLILFIAMILVAAVAAGVLIQTATNLQSKALETGSRSTMQVSTALTTVLLYGEDGRDDGTIANIFQNVRIIPGSDPVNLDDLSISVDLADDSADLIFNESAPCDLNVTQGRFAAKYLKNGSEHLNGYVTVGDVVQLCYLLPRTLREDESLRVSVVPKVGSVMTLIVHTPPAIVTRRVFLFP